MRDALSGYDFELPEHLKPVELKAGVVFKNGQLRNKRSNLNSPIRFPWPTPSPVEESSIELETHEDQTIFKIVDTRPQSIEQTPKGDI